MEIKLDPYLNIDTQKINSKLTEDLNMKGKTSKLLEKHIGEYFYDLMLGKNFSNKIYQ